MCIHRTGVSDSDDRALGLHDYIEVYPRSCVGTSREHGIDSLNLIGICQEGPSACATRHCIPSRFHRHHHRDCVDFRHRRTCSPNGLASSIRICEPRGKYAGRVDECHVPVTGAVRLTQHKYVELLDASGRCTVPGTFMRMEKMTLIVRIRLAAALAQFGNGSTRKNRLARGTLRLGRRRVNLAKIVQPYQHLCVQDHLVPPSARLHFSG